MVSESGAGAGVEELETVSKWDGETYVSSLEASNGVTKCRGIVFAPQEKCNVNSFTFILRLKRGNAVGFIPIIGAWQVAHQRVSEIKFRGEPQEITAPTFCDYTCTVPEGQQVCAGPDSPVVLGFYTEECTAHRSSAADIAQMPELIATPHIPHSLYLNGKFVTGTWRTYDSTLACRVGYTMIQS